MLSRGVGAVVVIVDKGAGPEVVGETEVTGGSYIITVLVPVPLPGSVDVLGPS